MRIISPFRDIYDNVQGFGVDMERIYHRVPSWTQATMSDMPWSQRDAHGARIGARYETVDFDSSRHPTLRRSVTKFWVEGILLVAGKAVSVWVDCGDSEARESEALASLMNTEKGLPQGHPLFEEAQSAYLGTLSPALRKTARRGKGALGTTALRNLESKKNTKRARVLKERLAVYDHMKERCLAKDWRALHIEQDAPVLLLLPSLQRPYGLLMHAPEEEVLGTLVLRNPCLLSLHAHTVLDPFTLYQEIAQYIGGVLPQSGHEMATVSDATQVKKKGFDPVYGFRTRPHKT